MISPPLAVSGGLSRVRGMAVTPSVAIRSGSMSATPSVEKTITRPRMRRSRGVARGGSRPATRRALEALLPIGFTPNAIDSQTDTIAGITRRTVVEIMEGVVGDSTMLAAPRKHRGLSRGRVTALVARIPVLVGVGVWGTHDTARLSLVGDPTRLSRESRGGGVRQARFIGGVYSGCITSVTSRGDPHISGAPIIFRIAMVDPQRAHRKGISAVVRTIASIREDGAIKRGSGMVTKVASTTPVFGETRQVASSERNAPPLTPSMALLVPPEITPTISMEGTLSTEAMPRLRAARFSGGISV